MRLLSATALLLSILCQGCDTSPTISPSLPVPVKGKITHRGKPLTQGEITFEPTDGGREAHGKIQPDGSFELTTFQEGDGALVGVHRVLIAGIEPPPKTKGETHVRIDQGKNEYVVNLK